MQRPPKVERYDYPPENYVPEGTISLSPEALIAAKEFARDLHEFDPKATWIVGFDWCLARTMRWTKDSEEFEEGPGIDVAGYRDSEIETDTVERFDGVPVVFLIPPDVVARARSRTVIQVKLNSGRASFALA